MELKYLPKTSNLLKHRIFSLQRHHERQTEDGHRILSFCKTKALQTMGTNKRWRTVECRSIFLQHRADNQVYLTYFWAREGSWSNVSLYLMALIGWISVFVIILLPTLVHFNVISYHSHSLDIPCLEVLFCASIQLTLNCFLSFSSLQLCIWK